MINPLGYDSDGEATLDILEYQNPWTPNEVHYALNSYGTKGRQAYLSYLFYDVIFVIARTIPIAVICAWAYKKAPEAIRPGVWMPIANLSFDLFENLLIFILIKLFPQRIQALEYLTAFIIQLKWFTFKVTLVLIFVSLLVGIYYTFHSLLADSIVLEKDRQQKLKAREQVQDVLQRSAARRAAAASNSRSHAVDKKNT